MIYGMFEYKRLTSVPSDQHVLELRWMHGDGDAYTVKRIIFDNVIDLVSTYGYLKQVMDSNEEINEVILDTLSHGEVDIEGDCTAQGDHNANLVGLLIIYYGRNGDQFECTPHSMGYDRTKEKNKGKRGWEDKGI